MSFLVWTGAFRALGVVSRSWMEAAPGDEFVRDGC
jgi:hypothetical protein